jgi:hypothetical protein
VYDDGCQDPLVTSVIDHVIVCVPDLEGSVAAFENEHKVTSVPGGRHRGHGTANRLIPLVSQYIELVAVVDSDEAAGSEFGKWVAARSRLDAADGLALRTDDLDAVCDRLRIEPIEMSRVTAGGYELRWRVAGLERLVASGFPFFIQWDIDPDLHPGAIPVTHPGGEMRLQEVVLLGDLDELQTWTFDTVGLILQEGDPEVRYELG